MTEQQLLQANLVQLQQKKRALEYALSEVGYQLGQLDANPGIGEDPELLNDVLSTLLAKQNALAELVQRLEVYKRLEV